MFCLNMKLIYSARPDRLTVMTSATWPPDVRRLATKYMVNPATVFVGTVFLCLLYSVCGAQHTPGCHQWTVIVWARLICVTVKLIVPLQ